jgi:lantibiotic modifying enzyme
MYLDVAQEIGDLLAREAIWHGDRCSWMGAVPDERNRTARGGMVYSTLGSDLYGGTAGVALFLATLAASTGEPVTRRTSLGAIRHALSRAQSVPPGQRLGLFTGWTGIALAATQVGRLLGEAEILDKASELLRKCAEEEPDAVEFDIISGRAGAIAALIVLQDLLRDQELLTVATRLGEELIQTAVGSEGGCSWRGPAAFQWRDLTGFSHGTAGAGYALLELYVATGEGRFREVAEQAFNYERRWFDPAAENWPDFRRDPSERSRRPIGNAFATAWCHGAPGIAISRLRALEITGDATCRVEAVTALRTTQQAVALGERSGRGNYSLCHGIAGNAEILAIGREILGHEWNEAATLVLEVAHAGIERYARRGHAWPCGTGRGDTPNLMLGLAGVGYYYLRLANPAIPSIMLIRPESFRQMGNV